MEISMHLVARNERNRLRKRKLHRFQVQIILNARAFLQHLAWVEYNMWKLYSPSMFSFSTKNCYLADNLVDGNLTFSTDYQFNMKSLKVV